jgi:pimeloyl-ACP methyl ester carboxylesterase
MQNFIKKIISKAIGLYINCLSYTFPDKALVMAYGFFSEPRAGKLLPNNLPEILKEAKQETIYYGQEKFQTYIWQGNSTKILLVHGWESNAARWERLIKRLKLSGSTIIALDAPAHGLSSGTVFDIPTYSAFIHELSKVHQPKIIIGHSMGAVATAFYQFVYGQKNLKKLILLGSPSDFNVLMQNYISKLGLNAKIHLLIMQFIKNKFKINIDLFTSANFLKNTTIAGLIIHDFHDDVVAFSEAEKIASSWKNAQFISTENLGHSMHDDNLNSEICNFLFES